MQLISCDSKQCKDWDLQQDDQSLSGFVGKAEFGLGREGCLMGKNHSVSEINFVLGFFCMAQMQQFAWELLCSCPTCDCSAGVPVLWHLVALQ